MYRIISKKKLDELESAQKHLEHAREFRSILVNNMSLFNFLTGSHSESISSQAKDIISDYQEAVENLNNSLNED